MSNRSAYIAGPLFNEAERRYLELVCETVGPFFSAYVPHRDGSLLPALLNSGMNAQNAYRAIFRGDVEAIRSCHLFVIVLNGRTIDEGAAVELGMAWAWGKLCVGLKEDFRQLTVAGDNPMIEGTLTRLFHSRYELSKWLTAGADGLSSSLS